MWRWHFLEHFSCTIHMQYKDTRGQKSMLFGALRLLERVLKIIFTICKPHFAVYFTFVRLP